MTAIGRPTIVALQLNRSLLVSARRRWVLVGWYPPQADTTENQSVSV